MTLYRLSGPWPGELSIASRPRGGGWLASDLRALCDEGVDMLISTLTPAEQTELGLADVRQLAREAGLEFAEFPIDDRGVPSSLQSVLDLVQRILAELDAGKSVATHCRAGIGRSSILASAVLVTSGIDVNAAFEQIEAARGLSVPDTQEQRAWVERFAREAFDRAQRAAS